MHTGLTQQLFQKQIVSKLISIKGSNAKGLYYGRIPISEARSKARSKIKKENPGISHKELNELILTDGFKNISEAVGKST